MEESFEALLELITFGTLFTHNRKPENNILTSSKRK
jgi:hypothetical protein